MSNTAEVQTPITATLVEDADRMEFLPTIMGGYFIRFEPTVFTLAERFCEGYAGGMWDFFRLSNGGFFIAPSMDQKTVKVTNDLNFSEENVSPQALGVMVTAMALSDLSFYVKNPDQQDKICDLHAALMEFSYEHPESASLIRLLD